MNKIALSFSYNGSHRKSGYFNLNPIDHIQMLIGAIDCANQNNQCDVIVSALNFDPWNMSDLERNYALEVYKRSNIILSKNGFHEHQDGAASSIRMATEYAAAKGYEYLIHLAEDVVMASDFIEYFVRHLEDSDYVGAHWIMPDARHIKNSLTAQVFGCRPLKFADFNKNKFVMPYKVSVIEIEMLSNINAMKLKWKVGATEKNLTAYPEGRTIPYPQCRGDGPTMYEHSHNPAEFRKMVEARGVVWCEFPIQKQPSLL